ncbi:hypothetical protein B0T10DRAFT_558281 [Thelonectria olida]|uniref:F-box domain-containing protein n=1 Tax=Thelonectria olida TaxID=1576542 RepID=A0A9P8WDF6_9HYPO|nr:hypothetical protein B0T10DRAFT_558281 [Thelonectria olida]
MSEADTLNQAIPLLSGKCEAITIDQAIPPLSGMSDADTLNQADPLLSGKSETDALEQAIPPLSGKSEAIALSQAIPPLSGKSVADTLSQAVPLLSGKSETDALNQADPLLSGKSETDALEQATPPLSGKSVADTLSQAVPLLSGKSETDAFEQAIPLLGGKSDADTLNQAVPLLSGNSEADALNQATILRKGKLARLLRWGLESRWARKYRRPMKEQLEASSQASIQQPEPTYQASAQQLAPTYQASTQQLEPANQGSIQQPAESRHELSLCDMPNELLLKIMVHLPKQHLWSLRQVSRIFLMLFDAKEFSHLHGKPGLKDPYMPFLIISMTASEKREAAKLTSVRRFRKGYCDACVEVLSGGVRHPRTTSLYESRFCEGCRERHAVIFFSAESLEKHDRGTGELICIGRLGKITLCSHDSHEAVTWETIERMDRTAVVCTDRSHEPLVEKENAVYGSALPQLRLHWKQIVLQWDLPLLDIDSENPPSTIAIRETLAYLVGGAFRNNKPCKHVLDGEQMRAFAYSGICECFKQPGNTERQCRCDRQQDFKCTECAAVYAWHLRAGRITLSYRCIQTPWKPTSPSWLGLLDDMPHRGHLLWCDIPGCATRRGPNWKDMVRNFWEQFD